MTTPLASVDQLVDRLGDVTIDETRIAAVLDDASAIVRSYAAQTWLDTLGALDSVPDVVTTITLAVARRAYLNPDGAIQQTSGPFTERYAEVTGQVLFLTDTEKAALDRFRATASLWAQGTTRAEDTASVEIAWFETEGASEPSSTTSSIWPSREPW